jgi:hypothetical protein
MHPLSPDFSAMSDTELYNKLTDLGKKIALAARANSGAVMQMRILYNEYMEEHMRREQAKLAETLKQNGQDFDDIIDVG